MLNRAGTAAREVTVVTFVVRKVSSFGDANGGLAVELLRTRQRYEAAAAHTRARARARTCVPDRPWHFASSELLKCTQCQFAIVSASGMTTDAAAACANATLSALNRSLSTYTQRVTQNER